MEFRPTGQTSLVVARSADDSHIKVDTVQEGNMTGIKEARVFFHRLLILGILLALVSVYLGPWQGIASAQTVEEGSVSISVPSAPSTVD